ELLESELFGHARGAFTGAVATKPGRIEHADGGTLFLDEVAELSPTAQAKLLRVLETHSVVRLGDVRPKAVDIRIVAATNVNIDEAVSEGKFRKDLYFRLGGATLWLPPLRDRPRDLLILARKFLATACAKIGREQMLLTDAAMYHLAFHDWPGNIRELRNLMTFIATTAVSECVESSDIHVRLQQGLRSVVDTTRSIPVNFRPLSEEVRELEVERMSAALAQTGGNQTQAAKLLSVPLRTFVNKLKRYGLHVNRNGP
ncbi:MAG: sigma 54-interacting transcriptional regulator, partial [Nannocystaceae bacterium]